MSAPEQNGVTPQDLLILIGELVVENKLLRRALEAALATTTEEEPPDAGD